jgi:hypothetical protein
LVNAIEIIFFNRAITIVIFFEGKVFLETCLADVLVHDDDGEEVLGAVPAATVITAYHFYNLHMQFVTEQYFMLQ